jgi:hypothetical protein
MGIALVFMATPALAGDFEDGARAYAAGNYQMAMSLWQKAAGQGNAAAQTTLGIMYEKGQGTAVDSPQAAFWYRQAADQGNAAAQTNLGFLYERGQGVAQDDTQAVYWYRKAAERGRAEAQFNLGRMYRPGRVWRRIMRMPRRGSARPESRGTYGRKPRWA